MINNETEDEIIEKFETEIISENKIIELEEELENANARADEANTRVDEANSENIRLRAKIKELENQFKNK